jgi:hypothetical protein
MKQKLKSRKNPNLPQVAFGVATASDTTVNSALQGIRHV